MPESRLMCLLVGPVSVFSDFDLKNKSPVRKNSKIDIVNMRYENTRKQKEKPEQIAKVWIGENSYLAHCKGLAEGDRGASV